ncbi:MAG: ABC transporter permease [Beijerinckiaceae bacterium]|nr:ABC transporter permease [Beijerinckiaceae bacterium]
MESNDLLRWNAGDGGQIEIEADGPWTVTNAVALDSLVDAAAQAAGTGPMIVDMHGVTAIDTFGACLIERLVTPAKARGQKVVFKGVLDQHRSLLDAVARVSDHTPLPPKKRSPLAAIEGLGRSLIDLGNDLSALLVMLGAIAMAMARVIRRPRSFRLTAAVNQFDRVGLRSVPIILLITFLIGAIIAQQGIFNFRKFGAQTYAIDLVGILVLRELGVLIVSIMVAGRSGSSYTAELGSMKMREEIDAIRTMGLDPIEILMLPRVLALVLALPMLTFIGSMSALVGGGLVSWLYGGMSVATYITRLRDAISVTHFEVGMWKAPFMALVIGIVACTEGLRVQGNTESLGFHTTESVVKSIFLVIVLDGFFAMFFASIGM